MQTDVEQVLCFVMWVSKLTKFVNHVIRGSIVMVKMSCTKTDTAKYL